MKIILVIIVACVATLFVPGIAMAQETDWSCLQGEWKGHQAVADNNAGEDATSLIIAGARIEFRGADTNVWYKGSFSLPADAHPKQLVVTIVDCPFPEYVGKKCLCIYSLEGCTGLILAGKRPGTPDFPTAFDAPDTKQFVFKKK